MHSPLDQRGRQSSRDYFLDAGREFVRLYGEDALTAAALAPAAAKRAGRPDWVERYYLGRPNPDGSFPDPARPWPSLNAIRRAFGGFNKFREALGLSPNSTGPPRGRRADGEAPPILSVRDRRVVVPDERVAVAYREKLRAQAREATARARAERLEQEMRDLKARSPETRIVRERTPKVVTKMRVERVRDSRREEKLAAQLEDARARMTFLADQKRAAEKDVNKLRRELQALDVDLRSAEEDAAAARVAAKRAEDRLTALERAVGVLRRERDDARASASGTAEAAMVADLVRAAEMRADEAEVRAARAEREMAEQGAAIAGEPRKLTKAELDELRRNGPAGHSLLEAAVKRVARAEGSIARRVALHDVQIAARNWEDRI